MVVGVDFGAPRWARDQRRKIIAIAAERRADARYRVDYRGMNERLRVEPAPGWAARELLEELLARTARVVACDFPFGVPRDLLCDPWFADQVGHVAGAFAEWRVFSRWIAQHLPLTDPLDFSRFAGWRDPAARARLWARRATDRAASAQPPLKDKFQSTFQMTLLGNALLSALWESERYRVPPFPGGGGQGVVIEVYPRATLRAFGLVGYKSRAEAAVQRAIAACTAVGLTLEVDPRLVELACRYSSGTERSPDFDVADAFIALCTGILHAEGLCRPALPAGTETSAGELEQLEGAIWVPCLADGRRQLQ